MPNWITNTVRIRGSEQSLAEIEEWNFDFNKLIPEPDILSNTKCGMNVIDDKRVREWMEENGEARLFTSEEEAELEKIGYRSWYDWACANWGVKWKANKIELLESTNEELKFKFDTPWASPYPIFAAMLRKWPDIKIKLFAAEECGDDTIESDWVADPAYFEP